MNKENLDEMTLSELTILCRNRNLRKSSTATKPKAVTRLLSYHKQNGYNDLKFEEDIDQWTKEALIPEGKAVGATNISTKTKKDIVNIILHPKEFLSKHKPNTNTSNTNNKNKNKNKNKKKPKSLKLNQHTETVIECCKQLEDMMIDVFNDLKCCFKPINLNDKVLPHEFKEYENLPPLSDNLIDDVEAFADKLLPLLPLILEAKSMTHDFDEYINNISEKQKLNKNKKQYYIGMKKYKNVNDYNQDEIGPICGVFTDSKQFDKFKKDKKIVKKFGKNIAKIKFQNKNKNNKIKNKTKNKNKNRNKNVNTNNNKNHNKMEVKSDEETEDGELSDEPTVSENDKNDKNDDNISIASEEALDETRKRNDNMLVSSDEDTDTENTNKNTETIVVEENKNDKQTENENVGDEKDLSDDDNDCDDDDIDMDKNKNKKSSGKNKNVVQTARTRSRRAAAKEKKVSGKKRKRKADDAESDKKRTKLNTVVRTDPLTG